MRKKERIGIGMKGGGMTRKKNGVSGKGWDKLHG